MARKKRVTAVAKRLRHWLLSPLLATTRQVVVSRYPLRQAQGKQHGISKRLRFQLRRLKMIK